MDAVLAKATALKKDAVAAKEAADRYVELVAEADKAMSKATAKLKEQKKTAAALRAELRAAVKAGGVDPSTTAAAEAALEEASDVLGAVDRVKPETGNLFVRSFLGAVNVRVASRGEREKLRDEYNKFKDKTNLGFLAVPLLWAVAHYLHANAFIKYTQWIPILTHVWLLYYYVSLALRENILRVNGSNIHRWWIVHHYVSAISSIVVLAWPPHLPLHERFTPAFTAYFLYQGIVHFFQTLYQKRRHYALVALGKKSSMDPTSGETVVESGLIVIVALAFIAHVWQVWLGSTLLRTLYEELLITLTKPSWYDFEEEVQVGLLGLLFCGLGLTNFIVTLIVLRDKSRAKASARVARADAAKKAAAEGGVGGARDTASAFWPPPAVTHVGPPAALRPVAAGSGVTPAVPTPVVAAAGAAAAGGATPSNSAGTAPDGLRRRPAASGAGAVAADGAAEKNAPAPAAPLAAVAAAAKDGKQ